MLNPLDSKCLFCKKSLRLDPRAGKLTKHGTSMRLYCDECKLVYVISIHGKYIQKESVIISLEHGPFKATYDEGSSGFCTKTRV